MKRFYFVFFSLGIFLCNPAHHCLKAQESSSDVVHQAVALYFEGKFREAEFTALRALQYYENLAPVDRAELHRILGFTYVAQGENEKAIKQFIAWLEIDPLANLNPLYVSRKIRQVFESAKEEYNQLKTEKKPPDYEKISLQIKAIKRSVIFPGLGQIYSGQQVKGYSLLTSEVVLIGAFIYCQVNYDHSRDRYLSETDPSRMQKLYNETNIFNKGRYASGILALGVYLFNLYDALYIPQKSAGSGQAVNISLSPNSTNWFTIRLTLPNH